MQLLSCRANFLYSLKRGPYLYTFISEKKDYVILNIARTHKHKFPWEKQIVGKSHIQGQFPNKQS